MFIENIKFITVDAERVRRVLVHCSCNEQNTLSRLAFEYLLFSFYIFIPDLVFGILKKGELIKKSMRSSLFTAFSNFGFF